jgi:hypothetical protein
MDKKEARKILGVTKETSINDIERRFSILLKKQRMAKAQPEDEEEHQENTPAGIDGASGDYGTAEAPVVKQEEYSFEQVTQAYNVLMGYEVALKEEAPSKAAPFLKKAGIDEKKARNFFYYYKFHMLVGIIVILILVFTVKGFINQEKPDFNTAFIGKISYSDVIDQLKDAFKANVPEIKVPGFDGAFLSDDDQSEQQYAMTMKATVLFASGDVDLFITDKESYLRYAKNGAFISLDEIAPGLGVDMEKNKDNVIGIEDTDINGEAKVTAEPVVKHLYGVDITNSSVLKESGVLGDSFIVSIYVNSKNSDKALKVIQYLMK